MRRTALSILGVLAITASLTMVAVPASADHTDPNTPLAPLSGAPAGSPVTFGQGTWSFKGNFGNPPGTDLEWWIESSETYAAFGTLGQSQGQVGQRILQLTQGGAFNPKWRADHGSAHCTPTNTGVTGLQHDTQIAGPRLPGQPPTGTLLIDATDAASRCHDPTGAGLELIDVTNIHHPNFEPREVHLIRHAGLSHTHTVDATRPWIVYNSTSDFTGRPWIDVIDVRTCLQTTGTLAQRRASCRPKVYRIPFQPDWSRPRDSVDGNLVPGSEAACHDITSVGTRLYCAAINATLIFNVAGLTNADGSVKGTRLPCELIPQGTGTGAAVTNCAVPAADSLTAGTAAGWQFLGTFNHPGRDCVVGRPAGTDPDDFPQTCNANVNVPPDEGVSVSHEADPSANGKHMFVTDERGGGVVPPGASCTTGIDNPLGNGGMHVLDITNPANIQYARMADGDADPGNDPKAVFISNIAPPTPTFCDIHVIEHIPNEQRLVVAYYSGGTKIVDYWIDQNGRWYFRETASLLLPEANTWAVENFLTKFNNNGTRTYHFIADDINRGIDIFTWTFRPNKIGTKPPASVIPTSTTNAALVGFGLVALPVAALVGRRRRRRDT